MKTSKTKTYKKASQKQPVKISGIEDQEPLIRQLKKTQKLGKIGNWIYDVENSKLWWSDELYRIFSLHPMKASSLYNNFLERVHKDDRDKLEEQINSGLPHRSDYRIVIPGGAIRYIHEEVEIDANPDGKPCRYMGIAQDITDRIIAEKEKDKLIADLQTVLAEVKTLRGIIPICSYCKHVRDDKGAWKQVESYVREHSDAEFSHGICPICAEKYHRED